MRVERWAKIVAPLLWIAIATGRASAQSPVGTITGRVTDSVTNTPISLVRVVVSGTARSTVTNDDGRYTLTGVAPGAAVVRVTRIGFSAVEQAVTVVSGTSTTANVRMGRTAVELAEVVSIGYGAQRRIDLTGAVSSVASQDLQKTIISTVEQGLQGRVSGVQVTQGDAAPGGGVRVQIRGVNSMNAGSAQPLFVIDGVPFQTSGISKRQIGATSEENLSSLTETNPLSTISSSEIESVDILKDASATAIYGSRGANGVVLITTRRGRAGAATTSVNYHQGFSSVAKRYDMLDAYDFATYVNQSYINIGQADARVYGGKDRPGSVTPDSLRKVVGSGTDWQDAIFRSALEREAQVDVSSGDGNGNDYLLSGSLLDQRGVIRGSEFRRGGFRSNVNRSLFSDRLRVSGNVGVTQSINNMVRSSTINGYQAVGVVRQALVYTPFMIPDSTSTDPRREDPQTLAVLGANPLRYTDEVTERDQLTRGLGSVRGVATFTPGLTLDVSLSGNYEARNYSNYFPRTVGEGAGNNGDANQARTDFGNLVNENLLRYVRQVGAQQNIDLLGGYTTQFGRSQYQSQEVRSFPDDILGSNVLANGSLVSPPQSGVYMDRLESWLARGNYSLLDRYLLTATIRRDGSSKFASNNKWAVFPAVAAAWRVGQERFLADKPVLSDLKLRLSYGQSGNQAIGSYQSLAAVSGAGCLMALNGSSVPCYRVTQLGNPDLRWETTTQFDAGVDFAAVSNRLSGTIDVYRKRTEDLLQQVQLPTSTGFANAWLNSGSVSNRGVEMQVTFDVLPDAAPDKLHWSVTANASHNVNRLLSLGSTPQQFAGRLGAGGNLEVTPFIQKPGYSLGTMWGYVVQGLIKTPADSIAYATFAGSASWIGDYKLKDLDGDGKLTSADQTVVGDANPTWTYGMNNTWSLGRFDFSALVTAVRGNSIINTERMTFLVLNGQSGNVPRDVLANAYDPTTNPNGTNQMVRNNRGGFGNKFLDVFVEDCSYVRLKNVQLGYRVPLPRSKSARLYLNMVNLLTSTKYSGFDPEVSAFGGTDRPGVDQGSYPGSRLITIGLTTSY
jgi:TonB-linked SusC/RagA family outer membrane protein